MTLLSRSASRRSLAGLGALAALCLSSSAGAADFVVLRDSSGRVAADGNPSISLMRKALLEDYAATGLELPEVLTVWTTFPMNGNNFGTYIDPRANDVTGIGLDETFGADEVQVSSDPPLRAILWHNNAFELDQRASLHRRDSSEGYGRYLFLLELSHLWGPDIAAPAPGPDDLIGFSYHWSFFLDTPGPAGGNQWTDNADGTFTVVPGAPATVRYSNLDLYLMGLADPDEVEPFGVLLPTGIPASPTDPFWGDSYSAQSFPWFDEQNPPMTVTAIRRELTIDDVVAANGPRVPGANEKTSWTVGIVLMVPEDATDEEAAEAAEQFGPFAETLAPAFDDATQGRGTLEVVSVVAEPGEGGGGAGAGGSAQGGANAGGDAAGGGGGAAADDGAADDGCGCVTAGGPASSAGPFAGLLALAAAVSCRSRRWRRPGWARS